MYWKRFRKLYSVGVTTMLILSSLISIFLWDGMDSAAAEEPLTPITTITGPDEGDNLGWNVSWVGDVNDDGFDDIIAGAPYADRYLGGDWWNTGWSYRKKLTFDNSGQSEDLVNFPVLVNLSASNFDYSKAKLDGTDLRFIDEDNVTEMNYEIEFWNSSGNSYIWVNVTNITAGSSTDYIWMYYGNSNAGDGSNPESVWDSNYVGVWHLKEDPGPGNPGDIKDSTINYNNGTAEVSMTSSDQVDGKIDGSIVFDGNDDYVSKGDDNSLDLVAEGTISVWFKRGTATDWDSLVAKGDANNRMAHNYALTIPTGSDMRFSVGNGASFDQIFIGAPYLTDTTSFHHAVGVWDGAWLYVYVDGAERNKESQGISPAGNAAPLFIGQYGGNVDRFNGIIDEVRISNIVRSADWIRAQYLSMNNTFITYGGEEVLKEDCGAAYIFFGYPGITSNNINVENANVTIFGSNAGDLFGWSVSDAGDVNNDGYDDVIIGAPGWGNDKGRAYIFHGRATASWNSIYDADTEADVIMTGENDGDRFGFSVSGAGNVNNDGYLDDWLYRKKITIKASQVMEDLTDFPVLINITDSNLQIKARSDGYDIMFTESDGATRLDHEIESYNGSIGELIAWVRIPILSSSTDTIVYMYYGKSDQSISLENPEGVWDDNYSAVWHLRDDPGPGSVGDIKDSTINDNDGTAEASMTSADQVKGKIDGSIDFDGSNDYLDIGTDTSLDVFGSNQDFTISMWIKRTGASNEDMFFASGSSAANGILLAIENTDVDRLEFCSVDNTINPISNDAVLTDTDWHYIAFSADRDSNCIFYVDGLEVGTDDISSTATEDWNRVDSVYKIATDRSLTDYHNGLMDEVRLSDLARSAEWLETEYNNQNDPSTFYNIGEEEVLSSYSEWNYRKTITIDSSKVTGNLTNFPVLINITDTNLRNAAQNDGDDIYFTSSDDFTKLDHEIEYYNGSSGELVAWVRIPSLLSDTDTVIYMYYGNSGQTTSMENPTGVWDDNYVGVWHLKEDPGPGNSGDIKDSTSNNNDGTAESSMTSDDLVDGKVDGSIDFDGSDDYISLTNSIAQTTGTYEFWIEPDSVTGEINIIASNAYIRRISINDGKIRVETDTSNEYFYFDLSSISANVWQHVVFVRAGDIGDLYVNGSWVQQVETVGANTLTVNSIAGTSANDRMVNGTLDEVRISNAARSAAWIATEYNNQNDTNSFFTVGNEEIIPQNWLYRKPITINASQVTDDLTDFPILINITDADLKNKASTDGYDIVFTESDGKTRLDHEIERYNSSSGELITWVRIPSLSSITDTNIYMYYGNSGISSPTENPTGVWDSNYLAVWHMNEIGSGAAGEFKDSTSNNYDGQGGGGTGTKVPSWYSSKFAGGLLFDGFDDYIDVSSIDPFDWENFTISAWYKSSNSSVSDDEYIFSHVEVYGDGPGIAFGPTDDPENGGHSDELRLYYSNSTLVEKEYYSGTDVVDQEYHYLVITRDTERIKIYDNGNQESDTADANAGEVLHVDMPSDGPYIGDYPGSTEQVDGIVDELRISTIPRSSDWINASFNNQNDTSTFFTVGNEEIIPQNWLYRKPITINASKVTDNLTDFPMLINIIDSDLKNKERPDGYDIIFTGDDGWTRLDHEIERYNSSSGELIAWVKIPFLSSTSDTVIYMHYGNPDSLDQQNIEGVWSNGFVGVYHMVEETGSVDNSASSTNDGTRINTPTRTTGQIGYGQEFTGSGADDMFNVGDLGIADGTNEEITFSVWANIDNTNTENWGKIISKRNNGGTDYTYDIQFDAEADKRVYPIVNGDTGVNTVVGKNTWIYLVGTYNGSIKLFYINGTLIDSEDQTGALWATSTDTTIGARAGQDQNFGGILDEVRLSKAARSASWIITEYNNQNDTNSFYTVGNEEQIGEGQTDNYDDVIVGAYGYGSDQGRAYIFNGGPGFTGEFSAENADVIINGTAPNDRLGRDVSRAGDVNNDGLSDVIIGAPGNNSDTGASYIFFGDYFMSSLINDTDADVSIFGGSSGDEFGFSLSFADDVNDDGYNDVIIGAPGYNSNRGRAYIFNGWDGMSSKGYNDIVTVDFLDDTVTIYNGTSSGGWEAKGTLGVGSFPVSVFVGDANNDGYNDILTTDRDDNTVTIYNGTSSGGWEAKGTLGGSGSPYSVFVGDANNDGYNDILIANNGDNTVTIYNGTSSGGWEAEYTLDVGSWPVSVFVGDANNDGYNDILTADRDDDTVTIYNGTVSGGWEAKGTLGVGGDPYSVFVGDANNDGYNDILTADNVDDTVTIHNGTSSGGWEAKYTLDVGESPVSVFVGDANNDGYNDILTADRDDNTVTIYNGTSSGGWEAKGNLSVGDFPLTVFVGDANNDGYNDILTADYLDDTVTVYNGTSGGWEAKGTLGVGNSPYSIFVANANNDVMGGSMSAEDADLILTGESTGDKFGYSVNSAGDVNGDGVPDVVVGAPYYDDGATLDAGAVYVFEGGASMDNIIDWSYKGEQANDHLGWSVSFAGNLCGDGLTYLIVGAPNNDDGGTGAGKTYILTIFANKPVITNVLATPSIQNIGGFVNITSSVTALSGVDGVWVNITLPGGGYSNVSMTQGVGDQWFFNDNYTIPGQYQYSIWANDTLGNWTESGIYQFQVINSPPLLSSQQVNPLTGYMDTGFNFTVVYTDLDNHPPNDITVNISGIDVYDLIEVDPSDTNYTDGKEYYYNISGLPVGLYSFHFAANDTIGNWAESGVLGFEVLNRDPILTLGQVDPTLGYTDTWFNFTANYTDLDNHVPNIITVNITGVGVYDLIEVDPLDTDYSDGKAYYYNASGFAVGSYTFHFAANDAIGNWAESGILLFDVLNRNPMLSLGQVDPTSGYIDTWFNFTVMYTDSEDHPPDIISVNITGVGIYDLVELDTLDIDYTDGKIYYYNISGFAIGSYTFHFAANDTIGNWTETGILQLDVFNRAPILTLEQVDPTSGYIDTWFNFTVNYINLDNNAPFIITVNITGEGVYDLIEFDPLDMNYIDGKGYYYNISGFAVGLYSFHFAANDTFGNWTEGIVLQFEVINRLPTLSFGQVNPITGYIDTAFNFTVTYTDMDDHTPDMITLNISGVGVYDLIEVDFFDIDYTDGKEYYYNLSGFAIGQYSFHFAANDTIGNWAESGVLQFDVINRVPTLSFEQVDPTVGDIDTWYNFSVTYTDLDDHAPDIITVNITGIGIYDLFALDPLDMDYTDGKVYYYNTSGFAIGSYSFNFAANDTQGDWIETIVLNFDVIDRVPTLLFEQVNPNTGYTNTWFNFTVTYADLDNHAPNVITVNITGIGIYDLFALDSLDMDYTDGKDYYYNISGFGVGQYSLNFAANDILGNWVETGILQFDVLNRAPTLSLEQVDPTIGYTDNWFNFTVNYTDLDNHAPFNITLNLTGPSGGIYDLVEVDSSDFDYTNGKEYYFNTTLTSGFYSFHFAAIDLLGMWASETMEINSPDVIPKQGVLDAVDYTGEFSDEIYLNATLFDDDSNPISDEDLAFFIDVNKNGIYEAGEFVGAGTTLADGSVSVIYSTYIATGIYNFKAIYIGSGDYVVNDDEALLIINAKGAILTTISDVVEEGEIASVTAILIDIDSNPIAFEQVDFYIDKNKDGMYYPSEFIGSSVTSVGGVALITYTVNLIPENYGIWAKYMGSANYSVNEIEGLLSVQNAGNSPPTILRIVPDQIKPEDSLPWPLDLTSYEADLEDSGPDLKWYLTGIDTSLYSVTGMNSSDDIFTFIPEPDVFGNDEVILWLWDSSGDKVSQVLWVNITPENDLPYFNPLPPNLFVHYDDPNTDDDDPIPWDYTFYVHDIETAIEDLIITTSEPTVDAGRGYAEVDGLKVNFHYPQDRVGESIPVFLTLSDGIDTTQTMVWVNVTSDWVPELVEKLPDIVLEENTTLYNVFDLDDYFIDKDHDSLYFSSGYFHIDVNINENNTVDITALGEWTGSELVTFRAWDPIGAIAEDTITVTVIPVNNPPVISDVPNLVVHYDYSYAFDLSPYIFDSDNHTDELIVWTSEPTNYLWLQQHNNLGIVVKYPESMNGTTIPVTIYVSDGIEIASQQIQINVTSNFPPELIYNLPDVFFDEDTVLRNAFCLSDHFIDIDSDVLFYTNGTKFINATINDNLTVDFSAPENWYGFEIVTFRATDPTGALAEDKILVVVVPVNDAPTIESIPGQENEAGDQWLLDLSQYIDDVDNNASQLIITVQNEAGQGYVTLVGAILMFQYPENIREDIITITVSDGELEASRSFIVSIKISKRVAPSIWDLIPWPWVFLFLVAGTSGAFAFYKKKSRYWVYEAFLIHEDGLPIAHASKEESLSLDDVVVSGMFTAVQNFINDTFSEQTSEDDWELDEMKFGDHKILIERSQPLYLAVIFEGYGSKLRRRVKKLLININDEYGTVFEDWDGDMTKLEDIKAMIASLIIKKGRHLGSENLPAQPQAEARGEEFEEALMDWEGTKKVGVEELDEFLEGVEKTFPGIVGAEEVEVEEIEVLVCPVCGKEIEAKVNKCPRCGVEFTEIEDVLPPSSLKPENEELKK